MTQESIWAREASIYDRNARSADACKRTRPNRTRGAASVDSGLTASHSASTAGHLPSVWSHATDGLEVLQSMRDKAPMPHLQHSISWEELLPRLRHSFEVVETGHAWPLLRMVNVRVCVRFSRICRILVLRQSSSLRSEAGRSGCSVDSPGRSVS